MFEEDDMTEMRKPPASEKPIFGPGAAPYWIATKQQPSWEFIRGHYSAWSYVGKSMQSV